MSGWIDIDGSNVMCGSPGIIGSLCCRLDSILGKHPWLRENDLKKVLDMLRDPDGASLRERVLLAAELIWFAKSLLEWTIDTEPNLKTIRGALIRMKRDLPQRLLNRGELWWNETPETWTR